MSMDVVQALVHGASAHVRHRALSTKVCRSEKVVAWRQGESGVDSGSSSSSGGGGGGGSSSSSSRRSRSSRLCRRCVENPPSMVSVDLNDHLVVLGCVGDVGENKTPRYQEKRMGLGGINSMIVCVVRCHVLHGHMLCRAVGANPLL